MDFSSVALLSLTSRENIYQRENINYLLNVEAFFRVAAMESSMETLFAREWM